MNDDLHLLRTCLEGATHSWNVNWLELRRLRGWNDFVMEYRDRVMDPSDLAAFALENLIADNAGTMNNAIMLGVTRFLIEKSGAYDEDNSTITERLRDLIKIAENPANFINYLDWAKKWFG